MSIRRVGIAARAVHQAGLSDNVLCVDAKTTALMLLALIAFASNSLLTRLALGAHAIDAATFTLVRLVSGAVVLARVVRARTPTLAPARRRSRSPICGSAPPSARWSCSASSSSPWSVTGIARGERRAGATWLGLALAMTASARGVTLAPVIAAFGAALPLHERLSARFMVCAVAVLGGVGTVLSSRARRPTSDPSAIAARTNRPARAHSMSIR